MSNPTLLHYAKQPKADRDSARRIKEALKSHWQYQTARNAYRDKKSSSTWWGCNQVICDEALQLHYLSRAIKGVKREECLQGLAGSLNYIHGVNPLGLVYLTNVGGLGAERYLEKFYHGDSLIKNNPPPGFMPGGPNAGFSGKGFPKGQPPQKAFDPSMKAEPSYEYFEGQVQLQSKYLALLFALINSQENRR